MRTHYDNLQVARNASDRVIRAAYKSLAQEWHPDKHPNNRQEAERILKIINNAYNVLSNPEKRKLHDEWIDRQVNDKTNQSRDFSEKTYENHVDFACDTDPIFGDAARFVVKTQKASVKIIQNQFKITRDHAETIINELERLGIIGPKNSRGDHKVYAPSADEDEAKNKEGHISTQLICPKCIKESSYYIEGNSKEVKCPYCKTYFKFWIVRVRAKRSQGNRSKNKRFYFLRVIDFSNLEHLIEFESLGYEDFELRARDLISLNYLNGNLCLVQNFTINQFMVIKKPKNNKGAILALAIICAIFFAAILNNKDDIKINSTSDYPGQHTNIRSEPKPLDFQSHNYDQESHAAADPAWIIQIASFSSQESAFQLASMLRQNDFSAFVKKSSVRGENYFRVQVGPHFDRSQAEQVASRLRILYKMETLIQENQ